VLGDVTLEPAPLVNWMLCSGVSESGSDALFDRCRPAVPTPDGAALLSNIRRRWPELFEGLAAPMWADRQEFIARLRRVDPETAELVRVGALEEYVTTPIGSIRRLVSRRTDLSSAFPDLLFGDATAFGAWLRTARLREHFLPEEAIDAFEESAGRALVRVFSFFCRTWPLMEAWPLALVGEQSAPLARTMLAHLRFPTEYTSSDVEMYLWMMETKPWAGLALTLELPIHTTRHPSSRSARGQEEILAPLLARDPRFVAELGEYRRTYPPVDDRAPRSLRTASDVSVFSTIDRPPARRTPPSRITPGANLFGYHRSPIGLGQLTRSLGESLRTIACRTADVVLTNMSMDADLRQEDFIRTYDAAMGTNIFVSYPHLQELLLRTVPDEVTAERRNVAYLAWEQSDGTHYWKGAYEEFDQVWSISDFSARSLSRVLQREVHAVPGVVNAAAFPPPSPRQRFGLNEEEYTFLFIYDATSSTERKNPEAAVEAFRRAFGAGERVRLVIKATNGDRDGNRARLRRLLGAIGGHPRIEVRVEPMSRGDVYGLISAADCYVSLHHCEGFAYTCAEAMGYGKPVIATGYSGNMHFMNEENSYPVRYREVEVEVDEGPFLRGSVWAEADLDHAAELMRRVIERRDEAAERGAIGRLTVERELSPAAVGRRIDALLPGLVARPTPGDDGR
jgi:glycosyltransferase involved in cell wall biosynthesis